MERADRPREGDCFHFGLFRIRVTREAKASSTRSPMGISRRFDSSERETLNSGERKITVRFRPLLGGAMPRTIQDQDILTQVESDRFSLIPVPGDGTFWSC